jgi:hypothetical protein
VVGVFAVLGLVGIVLIPQIRFDSDPLDTQNPHSEALETLRSLLNNRVTDPYSIDVLTSSPQAAASLADKLGKLPLVDRALSLASFVPDHQQPKLDAIADTEQLLAPTLSPGLPRRRRQVTSARRSRPLAAPLRRHGRSFPLRARCSPSAITSRSRAPKRTHSCWRPMPP